MTKQFGKYLLEELIGTGATAEVYRAVDTALNRVVALKLLKPSLVADEGAFSRFMQEAQAAGTLFHQNLATVLEVGEEEGRYYIAMRYVDGPSLAQILRQEGGLGWEETLKMARQVGAGLARAHEEGFLHRDIKPGNILRDSRGNYILTDFGLTRAMESTGLTSHTGAVLGTPAYIAPEVWEEGEAVELSDVYALACVCFEALTGNILFDGKTPPQVMMKHFKPPEFPAEWPEGVPEGIEGVLGMALALEPEKRYIDVNSFIGQLVAAGEAPKLPIETAAPGEESVAQLPDTEGESGVGKQQEGTQRKPASLGPQKPVEQRQNQPLLSWLWGLMGVVVIVGIIFGVTQMGSGTTATPVAEVLPTHAIATTETSLRTSTYILQHTSTNTRTPIPTITATAKPTPTLEIMVNSVDGATLSYIPGGEFQMGSEDGGSDEKPVHMVYTDGYWMYQYEVTNERYAQCVADGSCDAPRCDGSWCSYGETACSNYPVACMDWYGAQNYCKWAGGRLPTEAEWEKAALGGLVGTKYPWGDQAPTCTAGAENGALFDDCDRAAVQVGSFAPNGYGLYDMAGNVWEWVADWYESDYYGNSQYENPPGPASGEKRVLRGGSWLYYRIGLRVAGRFGHGPEQTWYDSGFRCVIEDG